MRFPTSLAPTFCALAVFAGFTFSSADAAATQTARRYTLVLGADGGSEAGCGTVSINARGAVRGIFRMADGTSISAGGKLGDDGSWPVDVVRRNGTELHGTIVLGDPVLCTGTLAWNSPGGSLPLDVTGNRYVRERGFIPIYQRGAVEVKIAAQTGDDAVFAKEARVTKAGAFVQKQAGPRDFTLRLDRATGLVRGKLKSPAGQTFPVCGVMLATANRVHGYLAGTSGGTFVITEEGQYVSRGWTSSGASMTTGDPSLNPIWFTTTTGAGTLNLAGDGSIIGTPTITSGGVIKTGTGTLDLSGNNPFTGGTLNLSGTTTTLTPIVISDGFPPVLPNITPVISGGTLRTTTGTPFSGTGGSGVSINPGSGGVLILGGTTGGATLNTGTTSGLNVTIGSINLVPDPGSIVNPGNQNGGVVVGSTTVGIAPGTIGGNAGTLTLHSGVGSQYSGGSLTTGNSSDPAGIILTINSGGLGIQLPFTTALGEVVLARDTADGDILFYNGNRVRVSRPADSTAIQFIFEPLPADAAGT